MEETINNIMDAAKAVNEICEIVVKVNEIVEAIRTDIRSGEWWAGIYWIIVFGLFIGAVSGLAYYNHMNVF